MPKRKKIVAPEPLSVGDPKEQDLDTDAGEGTVNEESEEPIKKMHQMFNVQEETAFDDSIVMTHRVKYRPLGPYQGCNANEGRAAAGDRGRDEIVFQFESPEKWTRISDMMVNLSVCFKTGANGIYDTTANRDAANNWNEIAVVRPNVAHNLFRDVEIELGENHKVGGETEKAYFLKAWLNALINTDKKDKHLKYWTEGLFTGAADNVFETAFDISAPCDAANGNVTDIHKTLYNHFLEGSTEKHYCFSLAHWITDWHRVLPPQTKIRIKFRRSDPKFMFNVRDGRDGTDLPIVYINDMSLVVPMVTVKEKPSDQLGVQIMREGMYMHFNRENIVQSNVNPQTRLIADGLGFQGEKPLRMALTFIDARALCNDGSAQFSWQRWLRKEVDKAQISYNNHVYPYQDGYQFDQNHPENINKLDIITMLQSLTSDISNRLLNFKTWVDHPIYSFDLTQDSQSGTSAVYQRVTMSGDATLTLHLHDVMGQNVIMLKWQKFANSIHVQMPHCVMTNDWAYIKAGTSGHQ